MQNIKLLVLKCYKKFPVIAYDVGAIVVAWFMSYWLRYNLTPASEDIITSDSLFSCFVLVVVQTSCYYYFKVYRGLWRFVSLNDVMRILRAVLVAIVVTIPLLYEFALLQTIPRSVFPLYALLLSALLCGARLLVRHQHYQKMNPYNDEIEPQRVMIVGAGSAAESLARDLSRLHRYIPVGFLDDNPHKFGLEIHGIRVLGKTADLVSICAEYDIQLIFLAIPSAGSVVMRRLVELCEQCHIPFRTLPSFSALASGFVQVNELREVSIDDLLGRDQVALDWEKIASEIHGKNVIVTGAGGSIGAELCRQVLQRLPEKLLLIENSEFNLYSIEQEFTQKYPGINIQKALISITDQVAINHQFQAFKPDIVFHAAAFKHVPMLEDQVRTAMQNNVVGTKVVAEASVTAGVQKFILISSDKAVNPTNVMGATKRLAEIYCQNLNERVSTQFITVRFGNVLGSAGSVVPLFQKQLQAGGPLTVTHPDISRYFMTIPEACQLILQAMVNGVGGEIFVLDMGEPIKIRYLAEQMIILAGKIPGKDIQIQYTGLRPGEKLYEELFHETEKLTPTSHDKLLKAQFRKLEWEELNKAFDLLNHFCTSYQEDELLILLKNLVPEYRSQAISPLSLS